MAALLDTASLITDAEVFNASSATAAERVKLLQFIQDVEAEVLSLRAWWFLHIERTFSFLATTREYNMAADVAAVMSVSDVNNQQITEIRDAHTWLNIFAPSATTGTPQAWNERPRDSSSQVLVLSFWPVPDTTENGKYTGRIKALALSDSSSNYSKIPEEFRMILSIGAHERMAIDEEKVQLQKDLLIRKDALVQQMINEHDRRTIGGNR